MKQILQSFKTGETELVDVPAPNVSVGRVLIRTTRSLVSLGTERMLVEFGKANLIEKARQQPEKVKMVLDKMKTDGIVPTLEAVFNKLEQPLPLGYCNVGEVIQVGKGVAEFKVGDRVASNGPHAEFVCVPKNLAAKIPDNVSDEEASFTVIGSIGLQGLRLCNPTFGETIVVIGLGLIGLITAELLKANGCRVIGVDLDENKLKIAKEKGIITINPCKGQDPVSVVGSITQGVGSDGVIITASAKSNDIISQAAQMSRKRGRIILVGVIGLNINRADFYEKELSFQVSSSYGPGRYDEEYENKGIDYPLPFVRWTEKRNFESILNAVSVGQLDLKPLITEEVSLAEFEKIYGNIGSSRSIASILTYPKDATASTMVELTPFKSSPSKGVLGIIGSGNFAKMTMLPALKGVAQNIKYIASAGGVTGTSLAKKHGISKSTTDYQEILSDPEVDIVLITTRHNLHAQMVVESLNSGKSVFVEKPLALNVAELQDIISAYRENDNQITVGFNRRFSPHIQHLKKFIGKEPMHVVATMNAGFIPPSVWVHDMEVGGGRIIGEACHFIDLIVHLTGSKVQSVSINALGPNPQENTDNCTISLSMENGSNGMINYFANGSRSYPKERLELYVGNKTFVVDNFRKTTGFGVKGFSTLKTKQDKGHKNQFKQLMSTVTKGGDPIIQFDEIVNTTLASFAAIESLKNRKWIDIDSLF